MELSPLEHLDNVVTILVPSFLFDLLHFIHLGNKDNHRSLDDLNFK